jgi:hypothetical protein
MVFETFFVGYGRLMVVGGVVVVEVVVVVVVETFENTI